MAQRSADGPDESPASTIQAGDTSSSIIVVTDSESAQSGSAAEPSKKLPDTVNEEAESEPDSSSGSSSSSASVASTSSISGGSENEASTPLLQGGKGKSTESQSTAGRRGAAAKAKPQPQPKSQLQMKSQASSKKKLKDAEKTVPWPKILAALGVCAAIAAVALWYYEGCTSGPWGEFGDCLPTLRGAPRCGGPGVRKEALPQAGARKVYAAGIGEFRNL